MKYFLDTEFMESPGTIELLSIGLLQDHPDSPLLYYAINDDAEWWRANPWVKEHVIPILERSLTDKTSRSIIIPAKQIRDDILRIIGNDIPEFWGYYADYDWVVFCWLFGSMSDLPTGWPMYCRDLKQWCDDLGNPSLPECKHEHHAGHDAVWNREVYYFLKKIADG